MRVAFLYVHCAVEKGRASRDCRWIGWLLREFERKNYWKLGVMEAEYKHIYDETKGEPGAVSSRQSLSNRGSKADIPRASVGFFPWGPRHLLDGSTHEPCTATGTKASMTSPDRTSLAEPSWARPLQLSCPSLDLILSFMSRSPVLPSPQAASTRSFQPEAHPLSSSHFSLSCSVSNSQTPERHRGPSSGLFLPLCPGPVRSDPATRSQHCTAPATPKPCFRTVLFLDQTSLSNARLLCTTTRSKSPIARFVGYSCIKV